VIVQPGQKRAAHPLGRAAVGGTTTDPGQAFFDFRLCCGRPDSDRPLWLSP
jgi:hypothetical protein